MVGQPNTNRSPFASWNATRLALPACVALVGAMTMTSSPVQAGPGPTACVEGTDFVSTIDGGYTYVAFKDPSGSCIYDIAATSFDYLVVGGGGGGGRRHAGGGGAGGMLTGNAVVEACSTLTVTVGDGGLGNVDGVEGSWGGESGEDSVLTFVSNPIATTETALGGGPGSTGGDYSLSTPPPSGGSGGGGYDFFGAGTDGQGNDGASGRPGDYEGDEYWGGGGGGAGSDGSQGLPTGGDGGAGAPWLPGTFNAAIAAGLGLDASLVSSSNVYFAGGGGGGATPGLSASSPMEGGQSGLGGGGRGGAGGSTVTSSQAAGAAGVSGSGGGGGGGGLIESGEFFSAGGDGGSGIVIVRFIAGDPCQTPQRSPLRFEFALPVVS